MCTHRPRLVMAAVCAMLAGFPLSVHAGNTIFVDDDAPAGGDGQSWATAYRYLKDALTAARNSGGTITEVWVAAGTYLPDHDEAHPEGTKSESASFELIDGVALRGGFAGNEGPASFDLSTRDFAAHPAVLSGDLYGGGPPPIISPLGGRSSSVVKAANLGATAVLDGFVVTTAGLGGAVWCISASPTIVNNAIVNGQSSGVNCKQSSPTIAHNIIAGNAARSEGGGIRCIEYGAPTISNNLISGNYSRSTTGPIQSYGRGGGIFCQQSSPTITDNTIADNVVEAYGLGGGVALYACSSGLVANNTIRNNTVHGAATVRPPAGALAAGGGIACQGSPVAIVNNTLIGNSASRGGGIDCDSYSSATIANNLVAFNSSGIQAPTTAQLTHDCVYNPDGANYLTVAPGVGDISVDPRITDTEYGHVHLQADSPCIDAGDSAAVQPGWLDIDGEPRVLGAAVDIGADEFSPTTPPTALTVLHVQPGGNDAQDGRSWATAKQTVQAAINTASITRDAEVWVAAGTYVGPLHIYSNTRLFGGFAGTETGREQRAWTLHVSVLDGAATGPVVSIWTGAGSNVVDGFTIRNGRSDEKLSTWPIAGGVFCEAYTSPTIRNCIITANSTASSGGGISCGTYSAPTIAHCTITGNSAGQGTSGIAIAANSRAMIADNVVADNSGGGTGGILCDGGSPTITRNRILDNSGGGINVAGGSSLGGSSNVTITHNLIQGNTASDGGGINCYQYIAGGDVLIAHNVIRSNAATSGFGGGISCNGPVTIFNNIISQNVAESGSISSSTIGSGIYVREGGAVIVNNSILYNTGDAGETAGAAIDGSLTGTTIANNIIAFNSSGIRRWSGTPVLRHNCVYNPGGIDYFGLNPGVGDFSADPLLLAVGYGDVHLLPGSPCIDAGDDTVISPDWADLDGEARIQGAHVDIGADEFNGTPPLLAPPAIRVSPAGDDTNDGSSWALAKRTVQAGIDAATELIDVEVWVAAGTYDERITLKPWCHVLGGFVGNETSREQRDRIANETILDGGAGGSVVTATFAGNAYGIDGFTIRNGIGTNGFGGGVHCVGAAPAITNNLITGNQAIYGAAISCAGPDARPLITGNTITANTATGSTGGGGGIHCEFASPTITSNVISANQAYFGPGIHCERQSSPLIERNTIASNRPTGTSAQGGGICCRDGSSPTIVDNMIVANQVGGGAGGGIMLIGSAARIAGCMVAGNTAAAGAGVYCTGNTASLIVNSLLVGNQSISRAGGIEATPGTTLINCTLAANTAPVAAAVRVTGSVGLHNCIIWGHVGSLFQGAPLLDHCAVQGGWSGIGNFDASPQFIRDPWPGLDGTWGTEDDDYGDLRLLAGSPCIDAGDNGVLPADVLTDFAGTTRFLDDPAVADCGYAPGTCGPAPIVDIGAYEFARGDFDYDGDWDGDDLSAFVACASGPAIACAEDCRPADFDGDGDVDQGDFGAFQRRFGSQ